MSCLAIAMLPHNEHRTTECSMMHVMLMGASTLILRVMSACELVGGICHTV
jgi:hypothetical protein